METSFPNQSPGSYQTSNGSLGNLHINGHLRDGGVLAPQSLKSTLDEIQAQFQLVIQEQNQEEEKASERSRRLLEPLLKQWDAYNASFQLNLSRSLSGQLGNERIEAQERAARMFEDLLRASEEVRKTVFKEAPRSSHRFTLIHQRLEVHQKVLELLELQSRLISEQDSRDQNRINTGGGSISDLNRIKDLKKIDKELIPLFGRGSLIQDLESLCFSCHNQWSSSPPSVTLALVGGHGMGKTESAFRFATKNLSRLSLYHCLRAGSSETLNQDYLELAIKLNLRPEPGSDPSLIRKLVHAALENCQQPYLLVYEDPKYQLELPRRGGINLITAVQYKLADERNCFRVRPLDFSSSYKLLRSYIRYTEDQLAPIIEFFDGNPLLLDAAGRYLSDSEFSMGISDYVRELNNHKKYSLRDLVKISPRYVRDYFSVCGYQLESLKKENDEAYQILCCTMYLPAGHTFSLDQLLECLADISEIPLDGMDQKLSEIYWKSTLVSDGAKHGLIGHYFNQSFCRIMKDYVTHDNVIKNMELFRKRAAYLVELIKTYVAYQEAQQHFTTLIKWHLCATLPKRPDNLWKDH